MSYRNLSAEGQSEFLRLLLDSTIEGFYAVDTECVATMCNKAFLQLPGYASADEVIGRRLHDEIHHSHSNGNRYDVNDCLISKAARGGPGSFVTDELFFRTDATSFPVEYCVEPIFKNGQPQGAVCTFLDVTEKRSQDKAIKELHYSADYSAERINLAIDSGAIIGTWVWDLHRDHFTADERFARTFGMDIETLREGSSINEVVKSIYPDDLPRVQALIAEAIERGGPYRAEFRILTSEGTWFWIEANGRVEKNAAGVAARFPGVLIDSNGRKRIEIELGDSRRDYKFLFDTIDQAFGILEVLLGPDGKPADYIFRP